MRDPREVKFGLRLGDEGGPDLVLGVFMDDGSVWNVSLDASNEEVLRELLETAQAVRSMIATLDAEHGSHEALLSAMNEAFVGGAAATEDFFERGERASKGGLRDASSEDDLGADGREDDEPDRPTRLAKSRGHARGHAAMARL